MGAALIPAGISLGTALAGKLFGGGRSKREKQADQAVKGGMNRYLDLLNNGQQSLDTSTKAAMDSAMPTFRKNMQDVQETEVARGVGIGGLGTSYEGDLESAFQKNIANATAGRSMDLYNTELEGANRYVDMLSGDRDYATAVENQKRKRNAGLFGLAGAGVGAYFGGKGGRGMKGAELGSQIGGMASTFGG